MNEKLIIEKVKYILFTKKEENMLAYNTGINIRRLLDMPINSETNLLIAEMQLELNRQLRQKLGGFSSKMNVSIVESSGKISINIKISENTVNIDL